MNGVLKILLKKHATKKYKQYDGSTGVIFKLVNKTSLTSNGLLAKI